MQIANKRWNQNIEQKTGRATLLLKTTRTKKLEEAVCFEWKSVNIIADIAKFSTESRESRNQTAW